MLASGDLVMAYSGTEKTLHINTDKEMSATIDITILNSKTEIVARMKLISGLHCIDLSSLEEREYAIRLVAGNNVWLQKIEIKHF